MRLRATRPRRKALYGEYLLNAQGEDVVAGIRTPNPIITARELPEVYDPFNSTRNSRTALPDMQDVDSPLSGASSDAPDRTGKRTARLPCAAPLICSRRMIDRATAVSRVTPEQLDQLLHPTVDPEAETNVLATDYPPAPEPLRTVIFDPD